MEEKEYTSRDVLNHLEDLNDEDATKWILSWLDINDFAQSVIRTWDSQLCEDAVKEIEQISKMKKIRDYWGEQATGILIDFEKMQEEYGNTHFSTEDYLILHGNLKKGLIEAHLELLK